MSSLDFGRRRPSDMKTDLPQPIRCRRPPFLLRVHPGASAVPSIALACREYAPMTQATSFPPSSLQTWQHVADVVGRLHGSHSNRYRFGAVRSLAEGGWRSLNGGGRHSGSAQRPSVTKQSLEISAKNHYFFLLQNPPTTTQLLSRVTVVAQIGYHTSIDDVMSPY